MSTTAWFVNLPDSPSRKLPPDPALIEAPNNSSVLVRLYNYGENLALFAENSIVISHAIAHAARHPSSYITWSSQTYSVRGIPVQLWVKREWGPSWFGESMTWGQWGARAQVLLESARDWEFVELYFAVINGKDNVDIAFGQLRRI